MFDAEIIAGGLEVISTIAAEWGALCDRSCREPFLRPEWFTAFAGHFRTEMRIVTVRDNGELRAVLPLERGRASIHGLPVSALRSVFDLNTPRFGAAASADERPAVANEIWETIKKLDDWDVFEARLVRNDNCLAELLNAARRDGYRADVWQMDAAPFIALPAKECINEFFSGSRKHFGKELDRRYRRLTELGRVDFCVTREYSAEMVDRYLELESLGWKGAIGTAAIADGRAAGLHHSFARESAERGRLFAYELRLDGRTIAMSLNIEDSDRMFHWRTSYDEAYARYSPGNLLFRRLFDDCIDRGLAEIDMLSPPTPNKRVWATGEREHAAIYIFRPGVIGRLAYTWKFSVMRSLRRLKAGFAGDRGSLRASGR